MREFFTVDRAGSLTEGIVDLTRWNDVDPPELQTHVDELWPEGVSQHGDRYVLISGASGLLPEPNIELLWEYARRAFAAAAPSRFQSFFAFESIEAAQRFRAEFGGGSGTIWHLTTEGSSFRADMRWLTLKGSALMVSHAAVSYWRQRSSSELPPRLGPREPLWEVLLTPPVKITERVA